MPRFVPRERKHKRLAKQQHSGGAHTAHHANAEVIIPSSAADKEARRKQLQKEIRAQQPQDHINSKKRKRLDHYVETKLKREENAELIRKLAGQKIDTDLLQSSKKLGRVSESKREAIERALRERNVGIDVRGDQTELLFRPRRIRETESEDEVDDTNDDMNEVSADVKSTQNPRDQSLGLFGSGLRTSLLSQDGQPLIKRRKRRRPKSVATEDPDQVSDDAGSHIEDDIEEGGDDAGSEWGGFDSDAGTEDGDLKGELQFPGERTFQDNENKGLNGDVRKSEVDDAHDNDFDEIEDESEDDGEEEEDDRADDDDDDGDDDEDDEYDNVGEDDDDDDDDQDRARTRGQSAFKLWAEAQRNEALGFIPSALPIADAAVKAAFHPRQPSPDPIAQDVTSTSALTASRPANAIVIPRSPDVQKARNELPVVQEEQRIMEAVHNYSTVIVCGATGSGKTTQVPQMMLESGYGSACDSRLAGGQSTLSESPQSRGMIGVTQPRRVAAVSVGQRVATELGDQYKTKIAHQVRYDTTVSRETAIKFMTDGILLREISQDFVLSRYAVVVIDEAHERSVNTDILIGMLSRIVTLRHDLSKEDPGKFYPLKLVIMSATLRVHDFTENRRLFPNGAPPIVQAEGRQHPVTVHFARKTQRDFVAETASKITRGHRKLPPGSMLVFLTGQHEIQTVAKRLKDSLGNTAGPLGSARIKETADQLPLDLEDVDDIGPRSRSTLEGEDSEDSDAVIEGVDNEEDGEFDIENQLDNNEPPVQPGPRAPLKAHILPLYAALPTAQQMQVFRPPPSGSRLIVLATNVAETSLTIPGIRYVFDCGRSKEKRYAPDTGVQSFDIDWISKASASQRTGRAGRTGPGHCWRLYSSAVYEEFFAEHSVPEILRTPIEGTVLQLKAMAIDNVVNFPFPTPPDTAQLLAAERLLRNLGAIGRDGRITEVGSELIRYPLSPRFGKMLMLGARNGILDHAIAVVAALAVGELVVPEMQTDGYEQYDDENNGDDISEDDDGRSSRQAAALATTQAQKQHQAYTRAQAVLSRWDDHSDAVKLLTAVAAHADATHTSSQSGGAKLAEDFFLREKGMTEVQQLRQQLHSIVRTQHRSSSLSTFKLNLPLANEKERKMLNQIVAAGFLDQVAIRADLLPSAEPSFGRKPRRAIEVAYRPLFPLGDVDRSADPVTHELQRSVFVHPSSVLARLSVSEMPSYVVYSHLSRAAPKTVEAGTAARRTRMHPLTTVGAKALAALAEGTPLLEMGKPVGKIEDSEAGRRRTCWVALTLRPPVSEGGAVAAGWPVGAWKVEQRRGRKGEWETERVLAR